MNRIIYTSERVLNSHRINTRVSVLHNYSLSSTHYCSTAVYGRVFSQNERVISHSPPRWPSANRRWWWCLTCLEAMATDVCRRHLQSISKHLAEFEQKPKDIDGNLIAEWFNVGEELFTELYNLGVSVKWDNTAIRQNVAEVDGIVSRVTRNQGWLQSFLSMYPGLRIDMEGATPAVDVCRVRSGLELLLQGFTGIDKAFDNVLRDLKQMGDVEEFDEHLKVWAEGHRPDFFPGDQHPDTPKSHWWWF